MNGREGLRALMRDVTTFHTTFDHPVGRSGPQLQPVDRVEARSGWIDSETQELREATTVADQVDAYIDAIYFGVGGLVDIGVDAGPIWEIVHRANMAKVQPDGTVKRREDGKIIKPDGWQDPGPQIVAEVERQAAFYK